MLTNENIVVDKLYTATGCGLRPNIMHWCSVTSMVIFSSRNNICLAMLDSVNSYYSISQTIKAHSDEVTCIKLVKNASIFSQKYCRLFCTSSSIGELALWGIQRNLDGSFIVDNIFQDQRNSSISLVDAWPFEVHKLFIANSQFDKIELHCYEETATGKVERLFSLSSLEFPGKIITSFNFFGFKDLILLAVGLSNGAIQLFYMDKEDKTNAIFESATTITNEQNVWVRALAFNERADSLWLAASSDNFVRIWKFVDCKELMNDDRGEKSGIMLNRYSFSVRNSEPSTSICINLESILNCDEGFIQSVGWHPHRLELLTSGTNCNVMRWQYSDKESIWLPVSCLGDAVQEGGGYFDAIYSPDGNSIIYHSLSGSVHMWDIHDQNLVPRSHLICGHSDSVTDIAWDPTGSYLLSCSLDKTTRVHAPLSDKELFFEIARPQIHGHSLNCISAVTSTVFVSGAEEKIFRVFQATRNFTMSLAQLANIDINNSHDLPSRAFQTELTLTNFYSTDEKHNPNLANEFFTEVPTEDQLNKFTLFPEFKKLYGHGFEVFAVACNYAGTVLASACKASHPEHATIFLWDTKNFQQRNVLNAHKLTVTRLSFSYNDKFLLSVSRDRTWTIFGSMEDSSFDYTILHRTTPATSKHSRIIWDCAWTRDSSYFATVSRDKTLNFWHVEVEQEQIKVEYVVNYAFEEGLNAVDIAPNAVDG